MKAFLLILVLITVIAAAFSENVNREMCNLPERAGRCMAYMPRFRYKPDTNECIQFIYGGCGGNGNNFFTKESCEEVCKV
ncbi:unnamed protein product [Hermetia illucens]|uniref:BPTI/Kunitz inhibitor domain-containing protein n=1 Tax=Hermetia illucens TaxID=343691 RepID=A0A7R8YN21_HERIL|nr:PI-stichotoxin-She2a-like [Hermetia illucens]CAD7079098.1 unnamed protein product [Hermetia illucens]